MNSNNADKLYHYRITISPPTNFLVKKPTIIPYDEHEFVFEGFSMFTTQKLKDLPVCNVVRYVYISLFFHLCILQLFVISICEKFKEATIAGINL